MKPPARSRTARAAVAAPLAFAAAAVASVAVCVAVSSAAPAAPSAVKRVLVVTVTKGFRHADSIPIAERVIADLGAQDGAFAVDYARTDDELSAKMTAKALSGYQGVVFANTTGDLPLPDRDAFLRWLENGGAFVGTHAAADTFHGWPAYLDMIGAEFKTHGPQSAVVCLNRDPSHPSMRYWGSARLVYDEIYQFQRIAPETFRRLIDLDRHPNDGTPGDFPLAWCKPYGRGRVFYTALGHRPDVWRGAVFQRHLLGGLLWALGAAPDAPPAAAATTAPERTTHAR